MMVGPKLYADSNGIGKKLSLRYCLPPFLPGRKIYAPITLLDAVTNVLPILHHPVSLLYAYSAAS